MAERRVPVVAHFVSMRTKFTPADSQRLAAVAEVVRVCTPSQAQRVLGTYRSVRGANEPGEPEPPALAPDLWWRNWIDDHGRYRVDGALDATTGELLEQARLAAAAALMRECDPSEDADLGVDSDEGEPEGARRGFVPALRPNPAEVIAAMATTVLEHVRRSGVRDSGGDVFAVQVICDLHTLAEALGIELDPDRLFRIGARAYLPRTGAHLSNAELARLVCEGTVQLLIDDAGQPLWLGTEKRLFNRHQRRMFRHRAGGGVACCEYPGCPVRRFVQAHHLFRVHDEDGQTDLDVGVLLCGFHHRELHRRGWRIERNGAQLTFCDGDRCLGSSGPPGPTPGPGPEIAVLPFQAQPPDPPPDIGPDSCRSGGGGEPLTRYGLDVLIQHLLDAA